MTHLDRGITLIMSAIPLLILLLGDRQRQFQRANRSWEFTFGSEMPGCFFTLGRWIFGACCISLMILSLISP